jgi:16S rRNA (uracil1498-N3)-methyltransferase
VCLLVGPEGGLDAGEIEAARAAGLLVVGLGALVLRTETVCAAALGALLTLGDPA